MHPEMLVAERKTSAVRLAPALLERWMREFYFRSEIDIGSSGVQSFSMRELETLAGVCPADWNELVFADSQTAGAPVLRERIASRWANNDPETVLVTHGSSEAIYLVMTSLLAPGDEVVALSPCYQQLYAIAESIGCRVVQWPLRFEDGYVPDLAGLQRLITPRTRMVIVNSPNNPTGAALTAGEFSYVLNVTRDAGACLLWDAAFADMNPSAKIPPSWPGPGCVMLGTLSKSFGLPGLRVGWCIATPSILELCFHARDYLTLHMSPLVEAVAERVVAAADRLLDSRRGQNRENLGLLEEWVSARPEHVSWVRPVAGVSAFPKLTQTSDTVGFCRRLATADRVLIVPGICFGAANHIRVGFGGATAEVKEGLRRLGAALLE